MAIVLEWVLVAEGDGGERHPAEEVHFDADAHSEGQIECNATVGIVDEETESRHEDEEPDDSVHNRTDHKIQDQGRNLTVQGQDQYQNIIS